MLTILYFQLAITPEIIPSLRIPLVNTFLSFFSTQKNSVIYCYSMNVTHVSSTIYPGLSDMLNDCSIDRVMAINCEWEIIAWNATSELLTGLNRQDVVGRQLTEVFPEILDDLEMRAAIESAFGGYKTFLPSATGRFNRHHIENHFIPLKDPEDRLIGIMNIMHDVAHRMKAEIELEKLNKELEKKYQQLEEANRSLVSFTNMASLEILEPVRSIYTSLEMLAHKEGEALTQTSRGNLRRMQASLNRINLLLADFLSISKISGHKNRTYIDLNELTALVANEMSPKLQAKDAVLSISDLPVIVGYPDMVKYLFHHLIENALKFQPQDNRPEISITFEKVIESGSNFHKICVKDNGIGLDEAGTKTIFEMFRRLNPEKYKGAGIGLGLCKKIMEMQGGSVYAEGVPGQGATICCLFPADDLNT